MAGALRSSLGVLHSFALWPAAEALLGLLFANLFWVGLWDLLDSTIFPSDGPYAMLTLVSTRPLCLATCVPLSDSLRRWCWASSACT